MALRASLWTRLVLGMALGFERWRAGFRRRTLVVDGRSVAYLDTEQGEQAFLLLHGFAGDKDNWSRFAMRLQRDYRCIAVDLPGFGETEAASVDDTVLSRQVAFLIQFLGELNLERVHVAGNSMGGQIALLLAATHSDRVRSVHAFDATGLAEGRRSEQFRRYDEEGFNGLLVTSLADYDRFLDLIFHHRPFLPCVIRRAMGRVASGQAPFFARAWRTIFYEHNEPLEEVLSKIICPVFVGWGDQDRVVHPSSLDAFAQRLPSAMTHSFRDCGHLPAVEEPAHAVRMVREALALHRESRPG